MQVDDALVDAHLVTIPSLGTLTTGGFAGGDTEGLGGDAHGALDLQLLVLGTGDQVVADCKKRTSMISNFPIFSVFQLL